MNIDNFILGYALGLVFSAVLDLPSGAVVVMALAVCAIVFAWRTSKSTVRTE